MKKLLLFCSTLIVLASCGTRPQTADTQPDVAITKIDGPLLATQQAPDSGGAGSVGSGYDTSNLLNPGTGPIMVAASSLYDPVTGQTAPNPLSVYVVASDALFVTSVELFQDGNSLGRRTKDEEGAAFNNPFIFPKPGSSQSPVTIQGTTNGMLSTRLRAVATDSSGQTSESAPLELQVDGSLPNLSVSVSGGNGSTFRSSDLITLTGLASDPETGIRSFDVTFNGGAVAVDASNSFTIPPQTLSAGPQTLVLSAVNGVMARNTLTKIFTVTEAPSSGGGSGSGSSNQPPVVNLMATPRTTDPLIIDFTASASDPENDGLTYSYAFGDGTTEPGAPTTSHTYAKAGTYTATVTVDDGNGGSASDSVVIPVGSDGSSNGGPVAPNITGFTADGQTAVDVAPNTDVALAWTISGTFTKVTLSSDKGDTTDVTTDNDQQLTVTPAATTVYTLSAENGSSSAAAQTVTVTVTGDNGSGGSAGAPVVSSFSANPDSITKGQDAVLSWSVDSTATEVTITPEGGTPVDVTNDDDKQLTVTPATTTTYTLNAKNAAASAPPQTVTVTVNDDNGGVKAVNDRVTTARGKAVTIRVLTNDQPSVQALTIVAATSPQKGGTVEISRDSKTIVYTPPAGFTGEDTFRYTVKDSSGNGTSARVYIEVR